MTESDPCGNVAGLQANAPWPMRGRSPSRIARSPFRGPASAHVRWAVHAGKLVNSSPAIGADVQRAVDDAELLKTAGFHAVVVGPVGTTRAQASPASIALVVQQRVPGLEVILTATTWEKSLMVLQADLLGTYAFGIRHVLCRTGTPPPDSAVTEPW